MDRLCIKSECSTARDTIKVNSTAFIKKWKDLNLDGLTLLEDQASNHQPRIKCKPVANMPANRETLTDYVVIKQASIIDKSAINDS